MGDRPRIIFDDEKLTIEAFLQRLRIGEKTFQRMLAAGLPTCGTHTQVRFRKISGRDFNRWIENRPLPSAEYGSDVSAEVQEQKTPDDGDDATTCDLEQS